MSENNNIEFSNILLLKENINEEGNKKKSNNELFKMELNKLKTNFNKLSINEIINKKEFNFKDLLMSKLNIQFPNLVLDLKDAEKKNNIDENDKIFLLNSPLSNSNIKSKSNYSFNNKNSNSNTNTDFLKEQNDANISNQNNIDDDKDEIINDNNYNVIITNKEKDFNSDINSDKDSFLMSSLHKETKTENIYSYNNDNDLLLNNNNKSFSSNNNNLFVVQTENNKKSKNRNLLGNKRNKKDNHTSKKNKKEELFEKIVSSYNKINKEMHNVQIVVSKEKTYEIKSIIVDNDKLDNIYVLNGKIKKIFSHKNNSFFTKEKDIVGELKIINDIFEKKL